MQKCLKSFLFIFLIFSCTTAFTQQVCIGSLGDPVININFGSGNNFGPVVPSTGYAYIAGSPNDGQYTVANSTRGLNGGWFAIEDHTPGDTNGYMMVINADNRLGVFYEATITNLCPGTTYEFAAWIVNILNYTSTQTKPNVTFTIENRAGDILHSYNTGNIEETSSPEWKQYATIFKTGNDTEVILKITNNGNRGAGNDIALDDITFRACGPTITSSINNTSSNISVCEGSSGNYALSAGLTAGYSDPAYQWQKYDGTTWNDIQGENSLQTNVNLTNFSSGTYSYRLTAAERQNIGSLNCRVASAPLIITINPTINTVASNNGAACVGGSIQLSASEGTTFLWTGPNGFTSTEKDPVLTNVQLEASGTYTVAATSNGCTSISSTDVKIIEPIEISINLNSVYTCESQPIQLEASGGVSYKWFPVDGLSNPNIANPIANPKESTVYTVTVSNGNCSATATLAVNIIKNAIADAGNDLKTLEGKSVVLNGKVTGDNVRYFWTPSDYLDDPTKLNPIATPPVDITYTLHAESNSGCLSSADEVFIKVYPKIIIANSFSPNGDGVNDNWIIPAIDAFPDAKIKVTNRYGNLVYENNGIYIPWDGKTQGKDLPSATYYYTIYLNEDFPIFSGWVFIVR
ncbi:gliding motility-associated C-terminal domain-containing protein [Pedobacter aquatilis]|uniref:gliding motility-associated C-terminal domain-containing protein n=1 Tax=Pedobacter aquatilis TaxID=351343 RepID=UPI0025B46711|nr:gliding motility-associated C-terminal domain-containing protein [Pedobacter aquatilis]MDN3588423.1 gliding motility-associated C-terminal domain-containing protein [Pedobacter aquatilis]